jgi:hypothetical protein
MRCQRPTGWQAAADAQPSFEKGCSQMLVKLAMQRFGTLGVKSRQNQWGGGSAGHKVDLPLFAKWIFLKVHFNDILTSVPTPGSENAAQTKLLALTIDEGSVKARRGPPIDAQADMSWPVWAGVVPLALMPGQPITDDLVPADMTNGKPA